MNMSEGLRKVFTAGIGVIVISGEKTKEFIDTMLAKGKLTRVKNKVLNQELQYTMEQTSQVRKDNACATEADDAQEKVEDEQKGLRLPSILEGIDSVASEKLAVPEDKPAALRWQ